MSTKGFTEEFVDSVGYSFGRAVMWGVTDKVCESRTPKTFAQALGSVAGTGGGGAICRNRRGR